MRINLLISILILLSGSAVFAQVDTLQLREVAVLDSPLWILEQYFVDLDNDGRKEIVICNVYNIYVYDSATLEVLWTSPTLYLPINLTFTDLNLDGLIDIAAEDDYHVYLFDPHASSTIWTSPLLENSYDCYTAGDRNGDGWGDVMMVSHEEFWRYGDCDNLDTTWIEVYDGPFYDDPETVEVLLPNYDCYWLEIWHRFGYENIIDAHLELLSGVDELQPALVLFSRRDTILTLDGAPGYIQGTSGRTIVIDGVTLNQSYSAEHGLMLNNKVVQSGQERYMYAITRTTEGIPYFGDVNLISSKLGANSLILVRNIRLWPTVSHSFWEWQGSMIDDIDISNGEYEVCYAADDTLYLKGIESSLSLWSVPDITALREVLFTVRDPRVFANPQAVCWGSPGLFEFWFYDGSDGTLDAILPAPNSELTKITDIEGDGIDEIIGLHRNRLYIYNIDVGSGIDDQPLTPESPFLGANYPNPFNSSTTIEFDLPETMHARIDIFDILGRRVETPVNEILEVGRHIVVWNASRYSSGLYFYRLEAGDYIRVRKMVYIK